MFAARFALKATLRSTILATFSAAFLALLLTMGACATGKEDRQTASSFYMGCYPSEIIVSGVSNDQSGVSSWTASCRGKSYNCAASGVDEVTTCRQSRQTG